MMGEGKYTRGEWKDDNKPRYERLGVVDSLNRHLMASMNGEKVDLESGLDHLYHVAVNALMLAEKYAERPTKRSTIQYPFPVDSDESD